MRLSEKEKKYVLVLLILMLLAGAYLFYTLGVEPFLQRTSDMKAELVGLEQQETLQNAKIGQLDMMKKDLTTKTTEAIALVEPFYPALPQDRLLLQIQDLALASGVTVSGIEYTGITVSEVAQVAETPALALYRLKELADLIAGRPVTDIAPEAPAIPPPAGVATNGIPQATMNLTFQGTHAQVISLIQAIEKLGRTVSVNNMNMQKSTPVAALVDPNAPVVTSPAPALNPDGTPAIPELLAGNMTLTYYAVEKPVPDAFMDWTLSSEKGRTDLFLKQYTAPITPGTPAP